MTESTSHRPNANTGSEIIALGAFTVGINLEATRQDLQDWGLAVGTYQVCAPEQLATLCHHYTARYGPLPSARGGGSVANTADLIARAGLSCGLIGVVGTDAFGQICLDHCQQAGLSFLGERIDTSTGHDLCVFGPDNSQTTLFTHGANACLGPEHIDARLIQNARLLVLDGFALGFGPQSEAAVTHAAELAQAAGVPFVLTLGSVGIVERYRQSYQHLGPHAQMVAGNLEQLAALLACGPDATPETVQAAVLETGINAVITQDAGGAWARFGTQIYTAPTQAITVTDTTGAGDNFLGAFLVARQRGLSIQQALQVGNLIAGYVVQFKGARLSLKHSVADTVQQAIQMVSNTSR